MKTGIFSIALILAITTATSQNLNEYKYVVVPESFAFLDGPNEYQLNALTKFLFEKYNFNALMKSEQKPSDLKANGCLGLYANVQEDSGLFVTKLVVLLENCNGEVVFRSEEGTSREKDFKTAHHEALREAFKSLEDVNYEYEGDSVNASSEGHISTTSQVMGEVAGQTPEENRKTIIEDEQEDEAVEELIETKTSKENRNYYVLENAVFFLEENNSGFSFFQKGMAEPFASLIESEGQDSFIYNSITKQGLAYFDNEGNLVIEHFDRNKSEMVKTVYQVQD